jgi:ATP-binding cassette, sub-family E, member 1
LKILAGKLKPNLGRYANPPDWNEITTYFRGSELQNYLAKIIEDNLKVWGFYLFYPRIYLQAVVKPQYVDQIPKAAKVGYLLL